MLIYYISEIKELLKSNACYHVFLSKICDKAAVTYQNIFAFDYTKRTKICFAFTSNKISKRKQNEVSKEPF